MNWLVILQFLIPLIEALLKLFSGNRSKRLGGRIREALDRCRAAAANLDAKQRGRTSTKKLLDKLDALEQQARGYGI